MNGWVDSSNPLPSGDNGAFSATIDPSMAFLQANNTIDPSQFQTPSPSQRMFNGAPAQRNASPAFHNPVYNVNPVIPSKRARPNEEGVAASPRQAPGGLPQSRSQTPHQTPFQNFSGPTNGSQSYPSHAPTPFQHLQQGNSGNATPSPTMSQQGFHPQGPQRVQTASPSPFSPAGPPPGPQMSPSQPDHAVRVNTPQNPAFAHMQQPGQFGQNFNPAQFSPSPNMQNMPMGGPPGQNMPQFPSMGANNMNANNMAMQNQRMYQMRMEAQARALHQQQQQQGGTPGGQSGMMANGMGPTAERMAAMAANGQMTPQQYAAMRQMQAQRAQQQQAQQQHPQQQQQQQAQQPGQPNPAGMQKPNTPADFIKAVARFMQQNGQQLDPNPNVSGRPLNLTQLYATVAKFGGLKRVAAGNLWPQVAQTLGFPPMQLPNAPAEISQYYMRNLAPYEHAWNSNMNAQRAMKEAAQGQPSPIKADPGAQQMSQTPQPGIAATPAPEQMNGFVTPPPVKSQQKPVMPGPGHQQTPSISSQAEATPPNGHAPGFAMSSPAPSHAKRPGSISTAPIQPVSQPPTNMPPKHPISDPYKPMVARPSKHHGPVLLDDIIQKTHDIVEAQPYIPMFRELGVIDLHALTLSLRSRVHAEVRVALDTLSTLAVEESISLQLEQCEELVDAMVECAEEQLDLLIDNAPEVSDEILVPPYEESIRGSLLEANSVQDVPEVGTVEYELDRSVDRLICITTLMRNFSFYESNFRLLGAPDVIKMIAAIIRAMGTRNMFLRTNQKTLDLMKDLVIFLSNIAHVVHLPGKEEAACILHFLLAFAPGPSPTSGKDYIIFPIYEPRIHKYLPAAVDSLAKLLARDEPNCVIYKSIFDNDGILPSSIAPAYDLLTRAFGLATAPLPPVLPDNHSRQFLRGVIEARKPFLLQGLLAADILSNLCPGSDLDIARLWLSSLDGTSTRLELLSKHMRIIARTVERPLGAPPPHHMQPLPGPGQRGYNAQAFAAQQQILHQRPYGESEYSVMSTRCLRILECLESKVRDMDTADVVENGINGDHAMVNGDSVEHTDCDGAATPSGKRNESQKGNASLGLGMDPVLEELLALDAAMMASSIEVS